MDINSDADFMSFSDDIFKTNEQKPIQNAQQNAVGAQVNVAPTQPAPQPVQEPQQPQYNQPVQPQYNQPVQPQYNQPVQPAQASNQPFNSSPAVDTLSLDEAQSELDIMKPIQMGRRSSNLPIEKYKGSKAKKSRIAIISEETFPLYIHYDREVGGSFICFKGECCMRDYAREKYCFPIIEFPTMADGRPIQGEPCALKLLVVGKDAYEQIIDIWNTRGNKLTGYDLLVSCTDDTYQKLSFSAFNDTVINNYPDTQLLKTQWLEKKSKAYLAVGKYMDAQTYNSLKNIKDPGSNVPDMNTIYTP